MTTTVTFDDVWKMFQESVREADLRSKESDRRFQETERLMRESSAETKRLMRESSAETKRLMRESSAETDRKLKDLAKQVGSLSSRWGEFVEGVVVPGCERIFAERGIPVQQVYQRVKNKLDGGRNMEIDILAVNASAVVLIEVKSKLEVEDVKHHLKRLEQFKLFFPNYADARVMGAVAGIVSKESTEQFASKQGLFVIVQSGETVRLANDEKFEPHIW